MNSFRENKFTGFVETQQKLLDANKRFKFIIDYNRFYKPFYNKTNQFILVALSEKGYIKGYSFIKPILSNKKI